MRSVWEKPFREMTPAEKFWRGAHIVSQVLIRFVLFAVLGTALGASGSLSAGGAVTERGTAIATSCEKVGPVSFSGIGWYWECDGVITWEDGDKQEKHFTVSELTPRNLTVPAEVEFREQRNAPDKITVDKPRPYVTFGRVLFIPLVPAFIFGMWIPGIPPNSAAERAEHRRRTRLQLWQPLMIPVSWGVLIMGGLGTAAPAVMPGIAVVTILASYVGLVVTWIVHLQRRRHGAAEPPTLAADDCLSCRVAGRCLQGFGSVGVLLALWAGWGNWLGTLAAAGIPTAVVLFGSRLVLVANRHARLSDGAEPAEAIRETLAQRVRPVWETLSRLAVVLAIYGLVAHVATWAAGRFAGFSWVAAVALVPLIFTGVRMPGFAPADQRAENRRRKRLQLRRPLLLPIGWGLLIAGGLTTSAPSLVPGAAVVTIALGYLVLLRVMAVALRRRKHGVAEPPPLSAQQRAKYVSQGTALLILGCTGVLMGVLGGDGDWLRALGVAAFPAAMLVTGLRLFLVTRRHARACVEEPAPVYSGR